MAISKIKLICLLLIALILSISFARAENSFDDCPEYGMSWSVSRDSILMYYLVETQTHESPHVDSIHIVDQYRNMVLPTLYAQPREEIDVSSLTRGKYLCLAYFGNCMKGTMFLIRNPESTMTAEQTYSYDKVLSLYPNPGHDVLFVKLAGSDSFEISIIAMDGSFLYTNKLTEGAHAIDISTFSKGKFLVHVMDGKNRIVSDAFIKF